MSTIIQSRCIALHCARCWAPSLRLLLVAALPLLASPPPPAFSAVPTPFFDPSGIEALSFLEEGTNAVIPEPAPPVKSDEQATPLFGMNTEPLFGGTIFEEWRRVKAEIAQELETVSRCRANGTCTTAAQRLLELSAEGAGRSGRARVGLINKAVDLAISPTSDETQWGTPDHWSAPFETLQSGRGDCEDYAIVKYLALLEAGISEDNVRIVILKNVFPNEDHAVLAVSVDNEWLILDNRTLSLVRDTDLMRAIPELILDQAGVRRFVSRRRNHGAAG